MLYRPNALILLPVISINADVFRLTDLERGIPGVEQNRPTFAPK